MVVVAKDLQFKGFEFKLTKMKSNTWNQIILTKGRKLLALPVAMF